MVSSSRPPSSMSRCASPFITDTERSHIYSVAKTEALCHSLEKVHRRTASSFNNNSSSADGSCRPSTRNCTRKLREALEYASCGSWFVDQLPLPKVDVPLPYAKKLRDPHYVDRYVDIWTRQGTPHMWAQGQWRR